MRLTISTADYERTHGRKPRGRGNWAFRVSLGNGRGGWTTLLDPGFFYGTLTEGRRRATLYARREAAVVGAAVEARIDVLG